MATLAATTTVIVVEDNGDEVVATWGEFRDQNEALGEELGAIEAALLEGRRYHGGGGAWASWSIALAEVRS